MNCHIRDETPGDKECIHQVVEAAFLEAPHADRTEPFIVSALRRSGALAVSLVAETEGQVVGHVAVSPVSVPGGAYWYALGPIAVLPAFQRQGIGAQLVDCALADLAAIGASGCVVRGAPDYYGRLGFEVVNGLTCPGAPSTSFQALSLGEPFPEGEVTYPDAFSATA